MKNPRIAPGLILPGRMLRPSVGPNGVTITFTGTAGVTYNVQRAISVAGPWTTISPVTVGEDGIGSSCDTTPTAAAAFYRTAHQ